VFIELIFDFLQSCCKETHFIPDSYTLQQCWNVEHEIFTNTRLQCILINRHLPTLHKGSKANRHIWGQYLEWIDPLDSEKVFFSLFPILLLGRRVEN